MPEGPSIVLAKEDIRHLTGLTVKTAKSTATRIDAERFSGTTLKSVRSWGKHLLLKFDNITLRIHFLMFGSYAIGKPKAGRVAKLAIHFSGGDSLFIYAAAMTIIEGPINKTYDWSADVMSMHWNPGNALSKLKANRERLICDALLDQQIFSGVGNIIKNEVLFRTRIHPLNKVGNIPARRMKALVDDAKDYSFLFLKWKRKFVLKKHWEAYTKKKCPRDGHPLTKLYAGTTQRRTFFCEQCQELFTGP